MYCNEYGVPKLELYAVFYFNEKFLSCLAGREFTLRVDIQALSWLNTYSMEQPMIGQWIARLEIISPQNNPPTWHAAPKRRWTQQTDQ